MAYLKTGRVDGLNTFLNHVVSILILDTLQDIPIQLLNNYNIRSGAYLMSSSTSRNKSTKFQHNVFFGNVYLIYVKKSRPGECIPIKLFYDSFKIKIKFVINFWTSCRINETFIFPPCKYKDDKYRRDIVR